MLLLSDGYHGWWDEPCRNSKAVSTSCELSALSFSVSHKPVLLEVHCCWNCTTFKKLSQNRILQEMTGDPLKFSYNTVCGKKYLLHFLFPGLIKESVGLACWGDDFWDQCRAPLSSSLSVPVRGSAVFVTVSGFRHLLAPFSLVHPSTALHPTPPIATSQLPLSPCIAFCMDSCDLASFVVNLWHCDSCHPKSVIHKDPTDICACLHPSSQ